MEFVTVEVIDTSFNSEKHEFPTDVNLSLMEALKASGYPIEATCGGMALCATCQVEILVGLDKLPEPAEAELDMLDTLPVLLEGSRLSCQIRVNDSIDGMSLRIIG